MKTATKIFKSCKEECHLKKKISKNAGLIYEKSMKNCLKCLKYHRT